MASRDWSTLCKDPCFALIFKCGDVNENRSIENRIVLGIALRMLAPFDPDIMMAYEHFSNGIQAICSYQKITHGDPEDHLGKIAKNEFPNTKIVYWSQDIWFEESGNVILGEASEENILNFYRCLLIFPFAESKIYIRTDIFDPVVSISPSRLKSVTRQEHISALSDVRELLGCHGYIRKLTILAGSPGWNSPSESVTHSNMANVRNEGTLEAAHNDFNTLFHLLQSLTNDDILKGITFVGMAQSRQALVTMLDFLTNPDPEVRIEGFSGPILKDSKFSNFGYVLEHGIIDGGMEYNVKSNTLSITEGTTMTGVKMAIDWSGRKSERYVEEGFKSLTGNVNDPLHYALLYYSGHGSRFGDIQIEKDIFVSPREIFAYSLRSKTPYVILLDMCYSDIFGERYAELLHKYSWKGLVLASHNGSGGHSYSFETSRMIRVKRPEITTKILNTGPKASHGVFTTAFMVALRKIMEEEYTSGIRQVVTLRGFVDNLLIPICDLFSENFGIPLQRPELYY